MAFPASPPLRVDHPEIAASCYAAICVRPKAVAIEFDPGLLPEQNTIVREAEMNICSLRNTFAGGGFRGSVRITEPRKRKLPTSARPLRSALGPGLGNDQRLEAFADSFRGELFCRIGTRWPPDTGTAMLLPNMMSLALILWPYTCSLASSSGRSVEPSSDMPADRPRGRGYVRTSARREASVSAEASRPLGPAAAEASAPNLTLLLKIDC